MKAFSKPFSKAYFFLIILTLTHPTLRGQNYKFGQITLEELHEKEHPIHPHANAAFIYRRAYSGYQSKLKSKKMYVSYVIEARKKIYSTEGLEGANITYIANKNTRVRVEAYIYQLRNGQLQQTEVNQDNIYEEDISSYQKSIKFTFPDVQVGDVIEYRFITDKRGTTIYPTWQFVQHIPVNYSEINMFLRKSQIFREKLTYTDHKIERFIPNEHPEFFTKQERNLGKKNHLIRYTASHLKPFEVESWLYNPKHYYDQIRIEEIPIAQENRTEGDFVNSWETFIKYYFKYHPLGNEIYESTYLRKEIEEKTKAIPREEQIEWALDYVHQKFEMPEDEAQGEKFKEYSLKESFEKSEATLEQKRMHFIKILRFLGFQAYEAFGIHRESEVFTDQSYTQLNIKFVAVNDQGQWRFYSIQNPLLPPGYLPAGFYNQKALILDRTLETPWYL